MTMKYPMEYLRGGFIMTQFNLSLESWREIIGYHPFHFWGLADNSVVPVTSSCNQIVKE